MSNKYNVSKNITKIIKSDPIDQYKQSQLYIIEIIKAKIIVTSIGNKLGLDIATIALSFTYFEKINFS